MDWFIDIHLIKSMNKTHQLLEATVSIGPSLCSVTDKMEFQRSGTGMLV